MATCDRVLRQFITFGDYTPRWITSCLPTNQTPLLNTTLFERRHSHARAPPTDGEGKRRPMVGRPGLPDPHPFLGRQVEFIPRLHVESLIPRVDIPYHAVHAEPTRRMRI